VRSGWIVVDGGTSADVPSLCWPTDPCAPAAGLHDGTISVVCILEPKNGISFRSVANPLNRGWYLPPQARPVDSSLEQRVACSDFVGRESFGSESGIMGLEHMYHIDQHQQCSSDSRNVPHF
jgi:hypothetical protein